MSVVPVMWYSVCHQYAVVIWWLVLLFNIYSMVFLVVVYLYINMMPVSHRYMLPICMVSIFMMICMYCAHGPRCV